MSSRKAGPVFVLASSMVFEIEINLWLDNRGFVFFADDLRKDSRSRTSTGGGRER